MSALTEMTFDQARKLKWVAGAREHRCGTTDEFQGDPVDEFYAEMLDASNYLDEMGRKGIHVPMFIHAAVRSAAMWARELKCKP